jgi:hypothetical protein
MKITFSSRMSSILLGCVLVLAACEKDEERLTASDTRDLTEEAIVDAYYQDIDDLGNVAIAAPSDPQYSGGRTKTTITIQDERFNCDGVVVTIEPGVNSTIEEPYGVLTVDFGTTGCADLRGNIRKGKLIFNYDGWRFQQGSSVVLTTENYSINDIKLEGTRTSTNISNSIDDAPRFHVVLTGGKATFPDNTVAERESDITWSWVRGASPAADKLVIHWNSTAGGISRDGRSYSVSLLEDLQYNRFCRFAVSGIKKYVIDEEKEITIDYGDGDCDDAITLTMNGVTREVSLVL